MEPGIELDELVAEKVFGWRRVRSCVINGERRIGPLMWSPDYGDPENPNFGADGSGIVRRYSRDIGDAWKVVERIGSSKFWISNRSGVWIACFDAVECICSCGDDLEIKAVGAETAPMAICLAALKGLGVDVPVP